MWQSGISERFACMRSPVQFLPAPGAAFPEVAVFTVVIGEFLDLASWSAVMQWKSRRSAVGSYVGHESLPLLQVGDVKWRSWEQDGLSYTLPRYHLSTCRKEKASYRRCSSTINMARVPRMSLKWLPEPVVSKTKNYYELCT